MGAMKKYIQYLKDNPEGYWFKRKLYGWGWTPATREGWFVMLVYIVVVVAFAFTIDENSPPEEVMFTFVLPFVFLTLSFILIAYRKGEPPRWVWGVQDAINKEKEEREEK